MHADKFRVGIDGSKITQDEWDRIFKKKGKSDDKRNENEANGSREKAGLETVKG